MQVAAAKAGKALKKKYSKPVALRIATDQVLLDLIEQAAHDPALASRLKASLHQGDSEYVEE